MLLVSGLIVIGENAPVPNTLYVIAFALVVFMSFTAILSWVRQYLVIHTGNRVDATLGVAVFSRLFRLPTRYFECLPTGVIAARHKRHVIVCYTYLCVTRIYVFLFLEGVMAGTVNFTGAVDRELLKRAKVIAAKSDTSVNALFNAELRYFVETFEAAEASDNQNFKTLLDFSLGRVDDRIAMASLGIDSQQDLFLLMVQAHLPMPRLPESTTQNMVDSLHGLVP